MANVGSAYVTLMPSMSGFASSISSEFGSAGSSSGSSFSSSFATKAGAVAGVVSTLANKCFTVVSSSLDSAISRVDTLNNFPRIMQNLGYSADEAEASITALSAGIDGLPTTLDSVVSMTQQLSPLCGSLDEATNLTLAMNNALVASGADTADVSRAFQQYTQILSTGKVDLNSWYTLQEVMPAQLNQIAQALLGTSANTTDLYNALSDGTLSLDDFNQALLSLNEEGINGFASFEQQAQDATAGIGTSIENCKTAVVKNLANIIDKLNETGAITGAFNTLKDVINEVGGVLTDVIQFVADNADAFLTALSAIGGAIATYQTSKGIVSLVNQFGDLKTAAELAYEAIGNGQNVFSALTDAAGVLSSEDGGIVSIFKTLGSSIGEIGTKATEAGGGIKGLSSALGLGPWGLVATAIAGVISALAWFFTQTELGQQIVATAGEWIQSVFASVSEFIQGIIDAVWPYIQQVIETVSNAVKAVIDAVWPAIQAVFETVWSVIQSVVETVMGVIQGIIQTVSALISGDWEGVWNGIKSIAESIWNGIKSIVETVFNAVKDAISNILNAIKSVWESIWNGITSFFTNIWEGIKNGAQSGVDFVLNVVTSVKDGLLNFFSGAGEWLLNAGKALLEGLWNGISGAAGWLWDQITGFFGGIVDGVLGIFGISSPSRVFAEIGGYTMEGLAVGIADGADAPSKSVESAAGAMIEAARDGLGGLTTARASALGTGTESTAESTLAEMLGLVRAIYEKPTDIYMDTTKVSSALASRSRSVMAGRGLA